MLWSARLYLSDLWVAVLCFCDLLLCVSCPAAGVNSLRSSEASLTEVARLLEVPAELLAEEVAQVGMLFCLAYCV
jgi:hypothetical protein